MDDTTAKSFWTRSHLITAAVTDESGRTENRLILSPTPTYPDWWWKHHPSSRPTLPPNSAHPDSTSNAKSRIRPEKLSLASRPTLPSPRRRDPSSSKRTLPPTSAHADSTSDTNSQLRRVGFEHFRCEQELSLPTYTNDLAAVIRRRQEEGAEPIDAVALGFGMPSLGTTYKRGKACLDCINFWLKHKVEELRKGKPIVFNEHALTLSTSPSSSRSKPSSQPMLSRTSSLPDPNSIANSRTPESRCKNEACGKELSLDVYTDELARVIRELQAEGATINAIEIAPRMPSLRRAYKGKVCLTCIDYWLKREIAVHLKRESMVAKNMRITHRSDKEAWCGDRSS